MEFINALKDEYRAVVGYEIHSNSDEPNEAPLAYKVEKLFKIWDIKIERLFYSRDLLLRIKGIKAPILRFVHRSSDAREFEMEISDDLALFLRDVIAYNYIKKEN